MGVVATGSFVAIVAAFAPSAVVVVGPPSQEVVRVTDASTPVRGARATVSGVRVTAGNAVDCPQIRDDAGRLHAVSYLSPSIAIGDRVTVTGIYAVTTRCTGLVLAVEREVPHEP